MQKSWQQRESEFPDPGVTNLRLAPCVKEGIVLGDLLQEIEKHPQYAGKTRSNEDGSVDFLFRRQSPVVSIICFDGSCDCTPKK